MTNPLSVARAKVGVSIGKNETQSENTINSIEGKSETVNSTEVVGLTNSPIASTHNSYPENQVQNELPLQSDNATNVEQVFQ